MYSAFSIFSNEDIIRFFENLGIELKEEDHGRMFPVTDKAQSVVDALISRLKELKVDIKTDSPIQDVHYENGRVKSVELKTGDVYEAHSVVIAVGGKSVPHTGSTGDGYAWAEKAGHTITELFPTEVPLTSSESFIKEKALQGLSLRSVALSVLNPKGKALITHRMDMIFTHFGISGPAVLRCSQYAVKAMKKWNLKEVTMNLDALPDTKEEPLFQEVSKKIKEEPKKIIKNLLKGCFRKGIFCFFLSRTELIHLHKGQLFPMKKSEALLRAANLFSLK